MLESSENPTSPSSKPDYENLVRFLIQPFLDSPSALKLDCEVAPGKTRVWIRLAFEGEDKGRVFGRGGRNIQAIRTVLTAISAIAGQSIHLDVFGAPPASEEGDSRNSSSGRSREGSSDRTPAGRPSLPKPSPRPRQ